MISRLTVLTAALAFTWTAAACSSSSGGTSEETEDAELKARRTCQYGESRVNLGASVPAADGCNECTCNEGSGGATYMACTEIACAPAATCSTGQKTYGLGETWAFGECNTCTCNEGNNGTAYVTCTGLACAPECKPVLCELFCADGFRKDADGCEICACQ